jgi:hypothetical protein
MDDIKVPISEDVQTFRPSSFAKSSLCTYSTNDKILEKLGVRHFQIFLMFVTLLIFYGHRIILSVGIIAMTAETPPDPSIPVSPKSSTIKMLSLSCRLIPTGPTPTRSCRRSFGGTLSLKSALDNSENTSVPSGSSSVP